MRKVEIGPQGAVVVDARSMLYLDVLVTLRIYYHAEPNHSGKGLVRVWRVLPLPTPGKRYDVR